MRKSDTRPEPPCPIAVDTSKAYEAVGLSAPSFTLEEVGAVAKALEREEYAAYTGWRDYPREISAEELETIAHCAQELASRSDVVVCIGVGGSYTGAAALISALKPSFRAEGDGSPKVLFAGHHLSGEYHASLAQYLESRDFSLVVISKSGTTLEPAIAFRLLKDLLLKRYGVEEARRRIVVITDPVRGALRELATRENYRSFAIPPTIGGRYSVLSAVGLLPAAVAGIDIREIVHGACVMATHSQVKALSYTYATARYSLYHQCGKKIELLASFDSRLRLFGEWWKQLFAESEGKEGRGLFPATATYTTDLHAIGQWIQQGERSIFETFLVFDEEPSLIAIPQVEEGGDSFAFLAGKTFDYVERCARLGTEQAHHDGGVPLIEITAPRLSAYSLGALIYFFELAAAYSGLLLEINPFDQPGVEAYKKHMYTLLNHQP